MRLAWQSLNLPCLHPCLQTEGGQLALALGNSTINHSKQGVHSECNYNPITQPNLDPSPPETTTIQSFQASIVIDIADKQTTNCTHTQQRSTDDIYVSGGGLIYTALAQIGSMARGSNWLKPNFRVFIPVWILSSSSSMNTYI